MQAASRVARIERGLGSAALFVGHIVTRAASVLPKVVGHASGLERPSPEAVAAGVVRGVTALAPKTLGVAGRPVELIGAASVLALSTWTVHAESDAATYPGMLADVIAGVEHRRLCGPVTAALWRTATGSGTSVRDIVRIQLDGLVRSAPRSLSRKAVVRAFADREPLGAISTALTIGRAWKAMGDAARLVEAARAIAEEHAARPDPVVAFTLPLSSSSTAAA